MKTNIEHPRLENNFKDEMIQNINDVFDFVLTNNYSDFYKKKYNTSSLEKIHSEKDFQKIPFLTKDEILNFDLKKRTFVPFSSVGRFTFSSGTTGQGKILAMPQCENLSDSNESIENLDYGEKALKELGIKRMLLLWPVSSSPFRRNIKTAKKSGVIITAGNIHDLKRSALTAKSIHIDSIATTATILDFFIEKIEEISFKKESIRWISLGGEFCSNEKLKYFREEFPNAFFSLRFGSSETGARGYRCKYLSEEKPSIFHPSPLTLIEINYGNDSSGYGEIIQTTLSKRPFPFIRYQTKDFGRLIKKPCPCGNDLILEINGRSDFDILKFSGVTLHVAAIEKALTKVSEYLKPNYEIHVHEKKITAKLKPKLILIAEIKKEHLDNSNNPRLIEIITEKISSALFLSSKNTLKDLIIKGIFLPLEIKLVKSLPQSQAKSKRIISHLQ